MKGTDPKLMEAAARRAALEAPTVLIVPADLEQKTGPTLVVVPEPKPVKKRVNWIGWLIVLSPFALVLCR